MATTEDFQVMIKTTESDERVFVDRFDEGVVWLSIQVRGASARVTLDRAEALEMVEAIQRALGAE